MTSEILPPITGNNLSVVWARAFQHVMARGVQEITPLVVTVNHESPDCITECKEIRAALDHNVTNLKAYHSELRRTHTVANTIFPNSMWNPNLENGAAKLFARFDKAWDRIKQCRQNRLGSYFRRMTAFRPKSDGVRVNQLEHIINTYRGGNHRRSALQAAIFDPALDHSNARRRHFPCLHQIAFTPDGGEGLAVTGFYATQYLFDRAYGNYLGLCRLGRFMAHEMGLKLTRMTCIASVAQRGTPSKSELQPLMGELERLLGDVEGNRS